MSDLHTWDAVATAAHLDNNDVTATEVVEAAIERAETASHLNGLVTQTFDRARGMAAAPGTGPFAGVPSAIKDLSHVAGVRTGNGSVAWQGYVPKVSDDTVRQFEGLGFVSLGKSAAPEFGLTPSGEPVGLPHVANPWAPTHTPGGSSSGAAALVAAGVVPVAYASDGGGSIRIPAANCGLVGLKPSHRRLALIPDMDRVPVPIATYGVVSRTVRDTAAFHAAAERQDPVAGLARVGDVTGPSSRRLRVGVVVGRADGAPLHPDVRAVVEDVATTCSDLGHHVDFIPVPFTADVGEDFVLYWGFLAQAILLTSRQTLGSAFDIDGFDAWTRGLAGHARRNVLSLPGAIHRLRAFRARHLAVMASWDVMITATLGTPPPPIGWIDPSIDFDIHLERVLEYVPYTVPQNISGLPAVSLPLGRTEPTGAAPSGLPIGVMFGGGPGEERTLLELAYELEESNPWPLTAPSSIWA